MDSTTLKSYLRQVLRHDKVEPLSILKSATFGKRKEGSTKYTFDKIKFTSEQDAVEKITAGKYEIMKLYGNNYNLPYRLEVNDE